MIVRTMYVRLCAVDVQMWIDGLDGYWLDTKVQPGSEIMSEDEASTGDTGQIGRHWQNWSNSEALVILVNLGN